MRRPLSPSDERLGLGQVGDHLVFQVEVGLDELGRKDAHPLAQLDVGEVIGAEHLEGDQRLVTGVLDVVAHAVKSGRRL
jgi:hypothetical protein